MDLMHEIADWLNDDNANYHDGLFLLEQVSKKTTLINFLRRKENGNNRNKLHYELDKIQKNGPDKSSEPIKRKYYLNAKIYKAKETEELPKHEPTLEHSKISEDDPVLHKLSIKKGEVHMERAAMANRMKMCKSDAQRKEIYANCLEIQERYDVVAKQINHYMKTGERLEEKKVPPTSTFRISENPMDWPRQLSNLRSNQSKLRKKLSGISEGAPKASEWKKKLNQVKHDIENVEKAIEAQR